MTGSQLQLLNASNQQQSGLAYARAQQQMQNLRQQGLDMGFSRSDAQYNRGQDAKNRYVDSIGNYEQGMDRNNARQADFREQRGGYSGIKRGVKMGSGQRDIAYISNLHGGKREDLNAQIAMANAQNAMKAQVVGSGVNALGSWYSKGTVNNAGQGISNSGGGQAPVSSGQNGGGAQQQQGNPQAYNYGAYYYDQNRPGTQRYAT